MTTLLTMKGFNKQAQPITTAWIYHSPSLWLISLSSDWTNWITIADKNLWATQVYNNWDTLSEANCGKYYQWWNNYWFPFTWAVTTSSTQVNAQNYWPWNYYSSSTFIIWWWNDWSSVQNDNLWWWVTWTNDAMQWPCDEWYHIPSNTELQTLVNTWIVLGAWSSRWWKNFRIKMKIPFAGCRYYNSSNTINQGSYGFYWSTNAINSANIYTLNFSNGTLNYQDAYSRTYGCSIRPFKDTPVQPDDSWTVLYPTN